MRNFWDGLQQASLRDTQQWASMAEQLNRVAIRDHQRLLDSFGENTVKKMLDREQRSWLDQMGSTLKSATQLVSGSQFDFTSIASQALGRQATLNLAEAIRGVTSSIPLDNDWRSIVDRDFLSPALLNYWSETARAAEQISGINNRLAAEIAESHALATKSFQSMVSSFDATSLADVAARQLGSLGLGSYVAQVRNVFEHIDFDAIRSLARRSGDDLSNSLDTADDKAFTATQLHEAIEQASLAPLRQMVEEAVSNAIEKNGLSADARWKKNLQILILYVLLPLLYSAFQVVGQPLFARWLEQRDANARSEKARPPTFRTHFDSMVAVKPEILPLRAGPNTRERIIATATKGQFLRVLKKKGLWLLALYVDPKGDGVSYTGWVKVKQTQRIEDETARLIWCELISSSDKTPQDGCTDDP